jgi:hypothetical protein
MIRFGNDLPYVSKRSLRNLWQEYRIYKDRLELQSWLLFRTFIIQSADIVNIEVRPRFVMFDLMRGKSLAFALAMKIDLSDLYTHVAIHRRSGLLKHIRITPNNPSEFVEICKTMMGE